MKIPWRVVLFTTNVIIVIIVPKGISDISLCFKVYSGELKNISRKGPPENRAMKGCSKLGTKESPDVPFLG